MEWIDIKKQLPKPLERVLIVIDDFVIISKLLDDKSGWDCQNHFLDFDAVDKWMPIPKI